MRIRKMEMPGTEEKETRGAVGNPTNLWGQNTQRVHKKVLVESNFKLNPQLIAAIVKRSPSGIKSSIDPRKHFYDDTDIRATLRESQYDALADFYGKELLATPVQLALKICDSDTTETTQGNDPSRFDVLHCLAENFDLLVKSATQKGHPVPDLKDILDYARGLNSHVPLHTFILGLSDERKEEAADILKAKVAVSATV